MRSPARSARRGSRPPDEAAVRETLEQLACGTRTTDQTLFDEIARCPDATSASEALARAIATERSSAVATAPIAPGAGWLLPP